MKVSYHEFIEQYRQSRNLAEVKQRTGMTIKAIQARAARYRKLGIDMPYFKMTEKALEDYKRSEISGQSN